MKKHLEKMAGPAGLAKKQAVKSLGLKPFLDAKKRTKSEDVQAAIRSKMAEELLNYEKKSFLVAALLWVTVGFLGGHRFYLGRTGSGAAMAITGGGFFFWWLFDGFRMAKLVDGYNQLQAKREQEGLPPLGLEFLPSTGMETLTRQPAWLDDERGKMKSTTAYVVDVVLMAFLGIGLAAITQSMGMLEPLLSAMMVILVFLFFNQITRFAHLPLVHELLYLEFKLRLFYTHHRPGNALKLFFRPLFGLFTAPFDRAARQEIKLYLEVSGVFASFLVLAKLLQALLSGGLGSISIIGWCLGLLKMFLIIYMVTSPIGAVMTKHILLRTHRLKIFLLGLVAISAMTIQLIGRI